MESLRSNEQRGKNAVILLWAIIAVHFLAIISNYLQYDLLSNMSSGDIDIEAAESNDMRQGLLAFLVLFVLITSAVTFIMWFRRAYFNLHQKVDYLSYAENWALWSWFVPILNLFRPFKIMSELYNDTTALLKKNEIDHDRLNINIVSAWWTFWVITNILDNVLFRLQNNADTQEALITYTLLDIISNVLTIIAAYLAIRVVSGYRSIEGLLSLVPEQESKSNENQEP